MERDTVDHILAEWGTQMPELDLRGRHLLWRLAVVDRHIEHRVKATVSEFGLSETSFKLMLRLLRAGPPYAASPTDLAREAMFTSGAMTNLIARVEDMGLVERTPDPHDRRGVRVSLTEAGLSCIIEAHQAYLQQEQRVLQTLTNDERDELTGLLRKMLLALESED